MKEQSHLTAPKNYQIIVITRFCFRGFAALKSRKKYTTDTKEDPLSKENLDFRMQLLELFCANSIFQQSFQGFDWVIMIDKDLPPTYFERLNNLAQVKNRTHIIPYDANKDIGELIWLNGIIRESMDWIVTINHDDDDILSPDYMSKVNDLVIRHSTENAPLLFRLFATPSMLEWDLHFTKSAPLGYLAPFHRSHKVPSCGFGLIAKYPELNCAVLAISHKNFHKYADFQNDYDNIRLKKFRAKVCAALDNDQTKINTINTQEYGEEIDTAFPTITTNHKKNVQWSRILENKPGRRPATKSFLSSYPGLDLDFIAQKRKVFQLSTQRLLKFYMYKPFLILGGLIESIAGNGRLPGKRRKEYHSKLNANNSRSCW